jgi:hypothetical protein
LNGQLLQPTFSFKRLFTPTGSDIDAAATAAAAMGLEIPKHAPSTSASKTKSHREAQGKSATDAKKRDSAAENDKRRQELRKSGAFNIHQTLQVASSFSSVEQCKALQWALLLPSRF